MEHFTVQYYNFLRFCRIIFLFFSDFSSGNQFNLEDSSDEEDANSFFGPAKNQLKVNYSMFSKESDGESSHSRMNITINDSDCDFLESSIVKIKDIDTDARENLSSTNSENIQSSFNEYSPNVNRRVKSKQGKRFLMPKGKK